MKEILITGGTGVLSRDFAIAALNRGWRITAINRGHSPTPNGAEVITADCHDYDTIRTALRNRRFDAFIDFLCFNKNDVENSFCFYSNYAQQYILISSCFVYDFSLGGTFSEDSPKGFAPWNYSSGKVDAECALRNIASNSQCRYTIVRPFVTYGNTRIPYGFSPQHGYAWTMILRARAGKPIITWNNGLDHCNLMHTSDFSNALIGLICNERAYGEEINICSDNTSRWIDVLSILETHLHLSIPKIDIPVEFIRSVCPEIAGEMAGRAVDVTVSNLKLKKILPAYKECISLEHGIEKTLNAYEIEKHQKGVDWQYDGTCDRIISEWCKYATIKCPPIGFINYLNNAPIHSGTLYSFARWPRFRNAVNLSKALIRKII